MSITVLTRVRGPSFDSRHLLRSSGSGTGSTQPRASTEELLGRNSIGFGLEKPRIRPYGSVAETTRLTSRTSGGPSVGTVRSRNKTTEFFCFFLSKKQAAWQAKAKHEQQLLPKRQAGPKPSLCRKINTRLHSASCS
jgi:hypothetical protein